MVEQVFTDIKDVKALVYFLVISVARPSGFMTGFVLINFMIKRSMMMRTVIGISLGLPIMVANLGPINDIFSNGTLFDRTFLPAKELVIGFAIGTLASLPFLAFKYAGHTCDSFRLESSNQLPFVGNETATTGSLLFFLIFAATFVMNGGLWYLMKTFYGSYLIWPLDAYLPPFRQGAVAIIVDQLLALFMQMIRVGLPFMLILFTVEFFLIIAARIARRFGLGSLTQLLKNLAFVTVLPLYAMFLARVADTSDRAVFDATGIFSEIFR